LIGTSNIATIPAMGILWLIPLSNLILNDEGARGNKYISRIYALSISSLLLAAFALESGTEIRILCAVLAMIITREAKVSILSTSQWKSRGEVNLPLHFAQFATNGLFLIYLFKDFYSSNSLLAYGLAFM